MSDLETLRDHARFMTTYTTPGIALEPDRTHTLRRPVWRYTVPTDAERALWQQIADEIDVYLAPDDGQETLL